MDTYIIKNVQRVLKVTPDGIFGPASKKALLEFKTKNGLEANDVLDQKTVDFIINKLIYIENYLLPNTQYVNKVSEKKGICLHHTAGVSNPYRVKDVWEKDDRGRVSTHYVIGGKGEHDGLILQCIPLKNWGFHIATSRTGFSSSHNENITSSYIGIEICNWGYLELKDGKYYNYVNREVPQDEVCILDKEFRGFKYWHKYTNAQISSTEKLICYLIDEFDFDISNDLISDKIDASWFDLSWNALRGDRVLTTHTNFEYGKFDCFPQPEMLEMLNRVYNKYKK